MTERAMVADENIKIKDICLEIKDEVLPTRVPEDNEFATPMPAPMVLPMVVSAEVQAPIVV